MNHAQSESPPESVSPNDGSSDGVDLALLHGLFSRQAALTPDARALSDENTELSYRELDEASSHLAQRLRALGVVPDSAVGIYMERSTEYVVAMLAAMKAGGAYLPLELAYPRSMLEKISAEAKPVAALTKSRFAKDLPPNLKTIELDGEWDENLGSETLEVETLEVETLSEPPEVFPENLSFIAYSSGTTGEPKGISNSHRAAATSYFWRFRTSDYGAGDVVGCNVFFVWEVLRPLLRGGASHVIPDDVIYDPYALVELLADRNITETLMTPSLLETTLNNIGDEEVGKKLPDLETLWLNGEVVTKKLAARAADALPHTRLLNVYSISEAHEVAAGDLRSLMANPHSTHCPVGKPIFPDKTYVLDDGEGAKPVPEGEEGELFVGGDCLAREYVGLPEKTAESFPEDPFAGEGRMYKTGDRARILPDGNLEILGRCDFMVKVRGYSIELGAVEAAIEERLPVEGCVVVADGEEGADKRLVAYLIPKDGADFDVDERTGRSRGIRDALKDSLPHYAIPAAFVVSDSLPLQETTGKVDRAELPPPPERSRRGPTADAISIPENPSEEEAEAAIARVWESALRLDEGDVSSDDDFFDIGGHSLAAAETLAKIEAVFGVRLPVSALLESPTPAALRDRLSNKNRPPRTEPDPRSDAVLESGISPKAEAPRTTLSEAENIFLTGATGFLGAFLLDEILRASGAKVHCLVRRREGSSPLAPIRENMERYGLWKAEYAGRIVPVGGDLGSPRLGLGADAFEEISGSMDLAFHAAASVNLVYPYSALKGANVEGTCEVLSLCCESRPTPLHFVSTNGVFAPGFGECLEDAPLDPLLDGLEEGYGISKWVAEKLAREAAERGLPVCVYRPGNISGHSKSGASNPRDFLTAMLSESVRISAAPDVPGWRMETTPVDFVAKAITEISDTQNPFDKTFHLANPAPPLAKEVFDRVEKLGRPLERLDVAAWMEARKRAGHPQEDIVGGVLGTNPNPSSLLEENRHDDSNTRRALENSPLERPVLNPELLANYLRHFEEMGWVPADRTTPVKRTA